jgi:type I restriction-modification system DNA methylase subunit
MATLLAAEKASMRNQNAQGKAGRRQGPVQLEHIAAIEKRLWNAADTLHSNSNYASNESFMPVSLASLIANVIEPAGGIVLDPACGSGGMFVQSVNFAERRHANPAEKLTFYGLENASRRSRWSCSTTSRRRN